MGRPAETFYEQNTDMFRGRLIVRFYVWFLVAMTVTMASAAAVVVALSIGEFEGRGKDWLLNELRLGRDITQNLLNSGLSVDEMREILAPATKGRYLGIAVVEAEEAEEAREAGEETERVEESKAGGRARGGPLVLLRPRDAAGMRVLPNREERRRIREHGFLLPRFRGHRAAAGLPIRLPGGRDGIFYVTVRSHFEDDNSHWRVLAGLGVILGVAWLLSWPLAAHLARPLREMTQAAEALGRGDLQARIRLPDHRRRSKQGHESRASHNELHRLARQFNAMAENLERLVLGHKQLLADISHELRSPLARLRVALELARRETGNGGAAYLDRVEQQADAMDEMIEELLFYSRLESAPYQLRTENLVPAVLVTSQVDPLRPDAQARHIEISLQVQQAPPTVDGDRLLLERALGNVMRNAVAYAPEGGKVVVECTAKEGRAVFRVSDDGPGVDSEQLENIFQPFVRTDAGRSRATGGVGLGLAIAKRCMEAHGGGVGAAQGPGGKGLSITLWLPLDRVPG